MPGQRGARAMAGTLARGCHPSAGDHSGPDKRELGRDSRRASQQGRRPSPSSPPPLLSPSPSVPLLGPGFSLSPCPLPAPPLSETPLRGREPGRRAGAGAHVTGDSSWSWRKGGKQSVTGSWTSCPVSLRPLGEVRPGERQARHFLCPTRPATTKASSPGTSQRPRRLTGQRSGPRQARCREPS